jgi:RND family efflux transporter MFP subunit
VLTVQKEVCMTRAWGRGAACVLLAMLFGCDEKPAPQPERPRVSVQKVQAKAFAPTVEVTGDVQARVQTQLSFRVSGKIIERKVDVGDRVTPRQVLARLDPKDLQVNVDSATAAVAAEQARVAQASAAFDRQAKLLPKGYTSRSEYDNAQASLRSSQSALAAARAQLANAREQLGYTDLVADAAGVVTARQAEVGQVVQATQPMFDLARDGQRDAVFNVYEGLFVQPTGGAPITVRLLDDPSVAVQGKVREVTPTVSAQTGTLQVKVALDALPPRMRLGSVVSGVLEAPAKPAVELPWSALTKDIHDPAVWLLKGDTVSLHKVTVGRYLTAKVVIIDGLTDGDQVVVAGGQLLHPDMQVEVAQEAAQ